MISGLDTKIIGKKIVHFETTDSTNLYAKKLVDAGAKEGTVVVSDVQTRGRGRKDRYWSSPKGGLWFSIILYPKISPEKGMQITMSSSVVIAESIKEITGLNPIIKWPNDLLINGKKVCGVLTEIESKDDEINYAIVGIGINVNNELEPELNSIATTLKEESKIELSTTDLLKLILENFDRILSKTPESIRKSWLSYSKIIGKKVQVKEDENMLIGIVSNVDNKGCLILDTVEGPVKILSGDISYL